MRDLAGNRTLRAASAGAGAKVPVAVARDGTTALLRAALIPQPCRGRVANRGRRVCERGCVVRKAFANRGRATVKRLAPVVAGRINGALVWQCTPVHRRRRAGAGLQPGANRIATVCCGPVRFAKRGFQSAT